MIHPRFVLAIHSRFVKSCRISRREPLLLYNQLCRVSCISPVTRESKGSQRMDCHSSAIKMVRLFQFHFQSHNSVTCNFVVPQSHYPYNPTSASPLCASHSRFPRFSRFSQTNAATERTITKEDWKTLGVEGQDVILLNKIISWRNKIKLKLNCPIILLSERIKKINIKEILYNAFNYSPKIRTLHLTLHRLVEYHHYC